MNAFFLQLLGRADALPGRGDLDQDPLAVDSLGLVEVDQVMGLADGRLGVEGEPGIDLGRDPAGDDLEDLLAETDRQLVGAGLDLGVVIVGHRPGRGRWPAPAGR